MNSALKSTVLDVAHRVRKWVEHKDSRLVVPTKNMCGWCAITAGKMYVELDKVGIPSYLATSHSEWGSHVFNIVDEYILDVTATQYPEFRNTKVVLLHEREAAVYEFYDVDETFECNKQLRIHQKMTNWPSSELAYEKYYS